MSLLGVPQITLDEKPLIDQLALREQALLFYLAVNGQVRNRTAVASLLWDSVLDTQALKNLRDVLPNLRKRLGSHLLITHHTIGFNQQSSYWLDIETFQHTVQARPPIKPAALHSALELYRGEFLEDFFVRDAPGFEEWLLLRRQQMHTLAVEGWQNLANHYMEQNETGFSLIAVRRLLGLEPWRESAHQQLMRLLIRSGQRSAALTQYEVCQRALSDGLDVAPSAETTALYDAILNGKFDAAPELLTASAVAPSNGQIQPGRSEPANGVQAPEPPTHANGQADTPPRTRRVNWHALPAANKLYGREPEVAQLERWLFHEQCHLVAICGGGGQGKTALATKIVRSLAEATDQTFDVILWHSLLNAPPLTEILQSWLPILSNQQINTLPGTLQQQFALLLDYLQQQRCLLVLDNLESILLESDGYGGMAGTYRPGYENYSELMRCFGETEHQSCLLITTRERPIALARLEEKRIVVRSLQLEGLSKAAGLAMLQGYGLTKPVEAIDALIQNYSGNPLALTLVGETIWEIFDGDIAAFAHDASLIFGDIRQVLDQQFARLNLLEREILFWLAIEREPVSLATLRNNLVQPEAQRSILESLRSLLRRSMLEKHGEFYSLQNVILEYITALLVEKIGQEIRIAPWLSPNGAMGGPTQSYYTSSINLSLSFPESRLNRFALIKAKAKAYVLESQTRLILKPLADQLVAKLGKPQLEKRCQALINLLRTTMPLLPGYAAANLLHLLLQLETDLHNYDFSQLVFWQANLRGVHLPPVTFAQAEFKDALFTESFGSITSLAFSHDENSLVAGTHTGSIFLWRLADQRPYCVLPGHTSTVFVALSPDGKRLASASTDGTLRLWDLTELDETTPSRMLAEQAMPFRSVVFSPDGRLLVSGSEDGTIRLWDGITGDPDPISYQQTSPVWTLAFAPHLPDSRILASAGDGDIYIWSLETGRLLTRWKGHQNLVWSLAFSADGRLLASGSFDHTVHLWQVTIDITDAVTNEEPPPGIALTGHTALIYGVDFHPAGNILASSSADQSVRLWDVQMGECKAILRMHMSWVRAIRFSPDGKILASGGNDNTIGLWHVTNDEYTPVRAQLNHKLIGHTSFARSVAFNPQGTTLAGGHADGLVRLWNVQSSALERTLRGHVGVIFAVAFSPDGQQLASIGNDGFVYLWKMPDGQLIYSLSGYEGTLRAVAFSPDGQTVVVGGNRPYVQLWNTQTGQLQRTLRDPIDEVWSATFSPDGQTVVIGTNAHGILLWDVASGELRGTLQATHRGTMGVAFQPGGALLATSSTDTYVRLWEVGSGRLLHTLHGPSNWVFIVAFNPAGNLLAASSLDGNIYIWHIEQQDDITNVQLRYRLHGHTAGVTSVAFSPDGQLLASAASDETIRFWDVESGKCVNILRAKGPYTGMDITGVGGLTEAQKAALKVLGAVEGNGAV